MSMICRVAKYNEYVEIAQIHLKAFNNFFLSSLGPKFLEKYYYACLRDKEAIAICLFDDEKNMVGFCLGSINSKGFHKKILIRNFRVFLLPSLRIIFSKPKRIFRLIKNLDKNTNKQDDGNYAELLSIGVIPEHNGKGYGKTLLKAFEDELKKYNKKKVALTTDFYNNEGVISFYKNIDYEIFYDFITYPNRRMYKLIKKL